MDSDTSLLELKAKAEEITIKFGDLMYSDFGWNKPKSIESNVQKMLQGGLCALHPNGKGFIYLNEEQTDISFLVTTAHECAHLYHKMQYRWDMRARMNEQVDEKGNPILSKSIHCYTEDIANLGALVFVSRAYPKKLEEAVKDVDWNLPAWQKIYKDNPKEYERVRKESLENPNLAALLFRKDPSLLKVLANAEFDEARKIIISAVGRDISLIKNERS